MHIFHAGHKAWLPCIQIYMTDSGIIHKEFYEQSMLFTSATAEHVYSYSLKSTVNAGWLAIYILFIEVAVGPVTIHILQSYRSGSHMKLNFEVHVQYTAMHSSILYKYYDSSDVIV